MSNTCRTVENCRFRDDPFETDCGENATCRLLIEVSGIKDAAHAQVSRDACQACCESFDPTTVDLNPIVASCLYSLCEKVADAGGVDGLDEHRALELVQWAEKSLPAVAPDEDDGADIVRRTAIDVSHVNIDEISRHLPTPARRGGNHVRDWAVGITTAPRRIPTLGSCAESILHAGWPEPKLFVDGKTEIPESIATLETSRRDSSIGAFPSYVVSLLELYMQHPRADAFMMVQDDALMLGTPATRDYLEKILWPCDGPCIASLYCSTRYSQIEHGWHQLDEPWVWGAVAFVFSREAVKALLTSPLLATHREQPEDKGLYRIDVLIGQFAEEEGIPIYYPTPSLVQHIGTISTIWNTARAVNSRHARYFIGDLVRRA